MVLRATALLAAVLVLGGSTPAPEGVLGTALVSGPAFLNGLRVGATAIVTDGDRLETGIKGGATLTISPQDRLFLGESSSLVLHSGPDGVTAEVERGRVEVSSRHQRLREVRLAGDAVSIQTPPGAARQYQVTRLKDASYVLARSGSLRIRDEGYGQESEVPEGMVGAVRPEVERLDPPQRPAAAPAGSGQRAGQITALMPTNYIVRGPAKTAANRGDAIYWNDTVESEQRGRVRMVLDDGSILSLGSGSSLQVIQHDAKSQQTNLQMQYGRVRAQVVKLAGPNSSFEIRTTTAVCGVLGTDFYLEADASKTRLVVFEGRVSFRPIVAGVVAAATAAVSVLAGQTSTAVGGAVTAPVSAGSGISSAAVTGTNVGGSGTASAGTVAASQVSRVAVITAAAAPPAATGAVASTAGRSGGGTTDLRNVSPSKP